MDAANAGPELDDEADRRIAQYCDSTTVDPHERIAELEGALRFNRQEVTYWRTQFEKQRGGETFDNTQKAYAAAVLEISKLKLRIRHLTAEKGTSKA